MKLPMLAVAALLSACANDAGMQRDESHEVVAMQIPTLWTHTTVPVWVVHDDAREVTCWVTSGGYNYSSPALSCIPDSQLETKQQETQG